MKNFNEITKKWAKAAIIRALKTMIQVMLTYVTIGMAIKDVNWGEMISAGLVAFGYSLLMNIIKRPPEVENPDSDGEIIFTNPDDPNSDRKLIFNIKSDLETIAQKDTIVLKSIVHDMNEDLNGCYYTPTAVDKNPSCWKGYDDSINKLDDLESETIPSSEDI